MREASSESTSKRPKWSYYIVAGVFSAFIFYFLTARLVEIIDSSFQLPYHFPMLAVVYLAVASLFITPPKTLASTVRRMGLITIVILYFKSAIDSKLFENIEYRDLTDHVAIVTGGNSGIGYSTVKHLVGLNCTVVMACRNMEKCQESVKQIQMIYPHQENRIIPMILDLSDLQSVFDFTTAFQSQFQRLDILVNNAGLICPSGRRTKQGFEELLGSMHIGHYALTRWLLNLLTTPIPNYDNDLYAARIINVASEAWVVGNFHPSIFSNTGVGDFYGEVTDNCPKLYGFWPCCPMNACPHTNGYARAKLANILHLQELQRRYDEFIFNYRQQHASESMIPFRRVVTASLHPGSVSSNIATLLKYSINIIRDIDDAGWIIIDAILNNDFIPSAFLDTMKGKHDLIHYRQYGYEKHLQNYPQIHHLLPSSNDPKIQKFSIHTFAWDNTNFIQPIIPMLQEKSNQEIIHALKIRLWEISENIVKNWEQDRNRNASELLGNVVEESLFQLPIQVYPSLVSKVGKVDTSSEKTIAEKQEEEEKVVMIEKDL